jgi:RimJ/RimL family protein N-acetyltransferase
MSDGRVCEPVETAHAQRPEIIDTDRLRLRPHRVSDFTAYHAFWNEAERTGAPGLPALGAEEAWYRLLRFVGHWAHFGYGLFMVEDRASGELIGEAGFADFHRGLGPRFDGIPEAGWRIAGARRGRGIATEAMRAAGTWLDEYVRSPRSVCMIDPFNAASLRVAARLGFEEFAREPYKGHPLILLQRSAPCQRL